MSLPLRLSSASLVALSIVACGGGAKPSAAPPPAPSEAPPNTTAAGDTTNTSDASATGPIDSTPAASASPASTAPAASSAAGSADPDEACTKTAVPYEEKVRPLFNECYREGKKKNPDLQGTLRINLAVNMTGKVTGVNAAPSELGDSVVSCMVKAVKGHPFDGSACKGKSISVGKTWGKP